MRSLALAVVLAGCAVDAPAMTSDEPHACARVEGPQLGHRVTVEVPTVDAVMPVTFLAWSPKQDAPDEYVGFTLDASADFVVKADFNFFYSTGQAWQNPFGDHGTLAKAIEYVELCDASRVVEPTIATP